MQFCDFMLPIGIRELGKNYSVIFEQSEIVDEFRSLGTPNFLMFDQRHSVLTWLSTVARFPQGKLGPPPTAS